jgi:hypothetical protein
LHIRGIDRRKECERKGTTKEAKREGEKERVEGNEAVVAQPRIVVLIYPRKLVDCSIELFTSRIERQSCTLGTSSKRLHVIHDGDFKLWHATCAFQQRFEYRIYVLLPIPHSAGIIQRVECSRLLTTEGYRRCRHAMAL